MKQFMLKAEVSFLPEGEKYILLDQRTRSSFRVGEMAYQILKQFEEASSIEEVCYVLRTEHGSKLPQDAIYKFIQRATSLDLLEVQTSSIWSRIGPSNTLAFGINIFDPNRALDFTIRNFGFVLNPHSLTCSIVFVLFTLFFLGIHWPEILALKASILLDHIGLVLASVLFFGLVHELAHGIVAKLYNFHVAGIGFQIYQLLPSFYCKIFHRADTCRKSVLMVLLSGSLLDLIMVSMLVWLCWSLPPDTPLRAWTSTVVSVILIKVVLVQLNPLWPYSDGSQIFSLLFLRKRSQVGE